MPLDATPPISMEEVKTASGLKALSAEWRELWRRCPSAMPFQTPEWMLPWWRNFGDGELCALTLRDAGRLIGLLPLYICAGGEPPTRRVLLLGAGNTDCLDALVEPEFEIVAVSAALAYLASHRERWDVCDFQQLRAGSPLLGVPAQAWLSDEIVEQDVRPALSLPGAERGLSDAVPPGMLSKLRYYRRRAKRAGHPRVETADERNFDELFDALPRLHHARWASRGETGVLWDERSRRFHDEVARGFLLSGELRLYGLRLDGRVIAVFYGFADRTRVYYYLGGFDPEYERLSPGTLLIGFAIEEALRAGASEFDFLRGREPYKYRWGAQDQLNYRRTLSKR